MFMPGHNARAPDRYAMLGTLHFSLRRSNAQDFNMLQVTFSSPGFMAAVETGLLQYVAPGHFHWKASLKQRFLFQATFAVKCFQVLQHARASFRAFFCVESP